MSRQFRRPPPSRCSTSTSIPEHGLGPLERPRERMLMYGPGPLSDAELLALVLGGGHGVKRGEELLRRIGGLRGIGGACPHELCSVSGIGAAGATAVCAALELGRRASQLRLPYADALRAPSEAAEFLRARWGKAEQEQFIVLGLDARQRVRLVRTVAVGSLSEVEVHPREVFRPLVRSGMHAVILAHNHPSGEADPSDADLRLTHRLIQAGVLVGIPVVDHLIVTDDEVVSFAQRGLLVS